MFNINQNFALKSAELFNFERDAYRSTADLFGQPLTYFPDKFVVTVTLDGSRYQLDKSKYVAPNISEGTSQTNIDLMKREANAKCWLPLPTVADKSKMANMVTSTGLSGGTITIAAGDGKAVKSLANGSVGQILKIGTNGLEWANENTFTLQPPTNGKIGGVKPGSGLTVDTAGTLSIKLGSGLGFDTNGNVGISNALRLTDTTLNGNTTITGTATVSDPSNTENDSQQIANVKYVNRLVGGLSKALVFIGEVSGGITPSDAKVGYVYVVTDNKTYAEQKCEPGDTLICKKEGIQTSDGWIVVEKNIDGAVTASSELANGAIVVGSGGTKVHTIATPSTQGLVLQTTGSGFGWKEPAKYQLTAAAKGKMGGVSIGDGIKVTSDGTISLSGGTGISITSDTISNTGVISVTSGTFANQISVKKGNNDPEIITIDDVGNAQRADLANAIIVNPKTSGDDVLVVGKYIPVPSLPGAETTMLEFKATSTISSTTDENEITHYNMRVTEADIAACVPCYFTIKPLDGKGALEENDRNWIMYDGSEEYMGLDAITWDDIDKLFNATPTV